MNEKTRSAHMRWSTMPHARMTNDTAPDLTSTFETQRCAFNARQMRDDGKSEAERRKEAFKAKRRGSQMIKKDRPRPALKPSPKLAQGPDRTAHNNALAKDHAEARQQQKIARLKTARAAMRDAQGR